MKLKSNFQAIKNHWIHKPDRLLDRGDWSYQPPKQSRGIPKHRLPEPYEARIRLEARMIIADAHRHEWEQAQQKKKAEAIALVQSWMKGNQ